jgi:hypothetical protein
MIEVRENLAKPEQVITKSCWNCANYNVCTIRTAIPDAGIREMDSLKPFKWHKGVTPPMPCGGSAWVAVDVSDTSQLVKLPSETWKQFMLRKKSVKGQLTELPG